MNKFLLSLFLLIPFISFSQEEDTDWVMFSYINQYRDYNYIEPLDWSDDQYQLSTNQSEKMISNDSLYHTEILKNSSECVAYGTYTIDSKDSGFINFVRLVCDRNVDFESNETVYMYILYGFSKSGCHSKTILNTKYKVGAVNFQILDKKRVTNPLFKTDKLVVKIACTINVYDK